MLSLNVCGEYTCGCDVTSVVGTDLMEDTLSGPQVTLYGVQYGHSCVDGDNTAPHLGQIQP